VDLERFRAEARAWLERHAERKAVSEHGDDRPWGSGSDSVAVFPTCSPEDERVRVKAASEWQRLKFDAGYGALAWPEEYGGAGLSPAFERAFRAEERRFTTPEPTELFPVTIGLVAPTIASHGSEELKRRFIRPLLRTDLLASQFGEAICRTDAALPRHQGLTAFLVPLDGGGVEVRPIRQMTGGASFNEVFLTDVRIPDDLRLGAVGEGWRVALTTLGFERSGGSQHGSPGGSFRRLLALARHLDLTGDAVVRQELAAAYTGSRLLGFVNDRVRHSARAGHPPGPEGSIRKLLWTENLTRTGEVAARLLGPAFAADTGAWGTYAWTEHLLGAPGYRIAGGSDEIQRNIIAERVLGLPRTP
jgi:alkylation response protein AidB-like acyl-CoA dehydrogenase